MNEKPVMQVTIIHGSPVGVSLRFITLDSASTFQFFYKRRRKIGRVKST